MIYSATVISDEMEKPFVGESHHKWKVLVDALIIVGLAFIFSTVFSTLSGTVVGEKLTIFSGKTLFSILSLINIITAFFVAFYLFADYKRMTFNDLYNNKMYMLIKLGQKPRTIVLVRLLSIVVYVLSLYFISFILSIILCLVFSYQLSLGNQFSLIIIGVIFSLASAFSTMAFSTFFKEKKYAILLTMLLIIGFILYAFFGQFYSVMSSQTKMMSAKNIFDFKTTGGFIYVLLLLSLIDIVEIVISCHRKSNVYHTSLQVEKGLVVIDYSSNKVLEPKKDFSTIFKKAAKYFNYTLFSLLCLSALATNFYLISIGSKNISNQYSSGTQISMIFGSTTMSPDIYENDFVTFKVLASSEKVSAGDIVYYQKTTTGTGGTESTNATVVKVININNGTDYNVNVTNPVSGTDMSDTLTREQIEGRLIYTSRPLGAWIVFNQSVVGKIIMIGLPVCFILFYDNISKMNKAYKKVEEEENEEKSLKGEKK